MPRVPPLKLSVMVPRLWPRRTKGSKNPPFYTRPGPGEFRRDKTNPCHTEVNGEDVLSYSHYKAVLREPSFHLLHSLFFPLESGYNVMYPYLLPALQAKATSTSVSSLRSSTKPPTGYTLFYLYTRIQTHFQNISKGLLQFMSSGTQFPKTKSQMYRTR